MLGYIVADERGGGDRRLAALVDRLLSDGLRLAGAVQTNVEMDEGRPCHMDLCVIGQDTAVRISQSLGAHSSGCRLDPAGLETVVGAVEAQLDAPVDLLIVNKFGKQEIEGRGFRELIAEALALEVPVLTAIRPSQTSSFLEFADDFAQEVPASPKGIFEWLDLQPERTRSD